jgi:hypothetical protein
MRKLLPALLASLAFISYGAMAVDPVKPEIGAGPHRDRSAQTSGAGESKGDAAQPTPAPGSTPDQRGGSKPGSSTGPSRAPMESADRLEDERKATQAKEKMKKKPGYREDVPSPRASHTSLHAKN